MLHDLKYDGEVIQSTTDTRRDTFGSGNINKAICSSIYIKENEERTNYNLTGCDKTRDNSILVIWKWNMEWVIVLRIQLSDSVDPRRINAFYAEVIKLTEQGYFNKSEKIDMEKIIWGGKMSSERDKMISALKKVVVPELRNKQFKGSFPHFRRISENKIDLITFQFDRYGGGFVIEIGVCSPEGLTHSWGEKVPPNKVTAHDINNRLRLKENDGQWFRYDVEFENIYEDVANEVLNHLYEAEEYWKIIGNKLSFLN